MRIPISCLAPLALAVSASFARAQTAGDVRAAAALQSTHVGALTPMMTPAMISRRLNGAQFGLRYGLLDEDGTRTQAVAAALTFLAGLASSVTLNAGVLDADCPNCSPALMLGAGADMRVADVAEVLGSGSQLSVAVSGEFGYARLEPSDDYALALGIGAPVTLSLGGGGREGLRFVPFVTPMFGVGETSTPCLIGGCTRSGTRWVLGGGLGVWNPMSNLSASVGVNQVMISGAQPVFGVNVVFGGR